MVNGNRPLTTSLRIMFVQLRDTFRKVVYGKFALSYVAKNGNIFSFCAVVFYVAEHACYVETIDYYSLNVCHIHVSMPRLS